MAEVALEEEQEVDFLWESRRWYLCCGWHGDPCYTRWRWDRSRLAVPKAQRPSTTLYRKELVKVKKAKQKAALVPPVPRPVPAPTQVSRQAPPHYHVAVLAQPKLALPFILLVVHRRRTGSGRSSWMQIRTGTGGRYGGSLVHSRQGWAGGPHANVLNFHFI